MNNSEQLDEDFSIRVRFRISGGDKVEIEDVKAVFSEESQRQVTLISRDKEKTIRQADWLVLLQHGFESSKEAERESELLLDSLRRACAKIKIGADLGRRSPKGFVYDSFLRKLESHSGENILNDVHGASIYKTNLDPQFVQVGIPEFTISVQENRFKKAFLKALKSETNLSESERIAFDLFSIANDLRKSADARFVLLFAALETLIEDQPRTDEAIAHVNQLIDLTELSNLERDEKNSLIGSLRYLRSNSIRSSAKLFLKERLKGKKYDNKPVDEVFDDCYKVRNKFMHGGLPFPTSKETGKLSGNLFLMVGDLLAGTELVQEDL